MGCDFSDIEIVDRLLRGEPGAFELFYEKYARDFYGWIHKLAAADADDILQSFFERLMKTDYRALRLWRRESSLRIYLQAVIRNFVYGAQLAKHRRDRRETPEGGLSELEKHAPLGDEEPTTAIGLKELKRDARRAWAMLNERDRLLVHCKFYMDLTNEEIGERLTPPLKDDALRKALFDAKKRWLVNLKKLAPEYFPK